MSACSGSERMTRRLGFVYLAALVLASALAGSRANAGSVTAVDHGDKISIDARKGRVTVESGDSINDTHRVVVMGPRVMVDDNGELVRVFSDAEVPEGQRIDGDVVTIFGSSRIKGHVTGNAVSVCGSVELGPHATVDGDMVAILGVIDRAEGATVGGESVDIGVMPPFPGMPALPSILLVVGLGFFALSIAYAFGCDRL